MNEWYCVVLVGLFLKRDGDSNHCGRRAENDEHDEDTKKASRNARKECHFAFDLLCSLWGGGRILADRLYREDCNFATAPVFSKSYQKKFDGSAAAADTKCVNPGLITSGIRFQAERRV
jgi:hypothetical protein